MTRQCARPGCSAVASATLAYDYRQRTTWLDPLAEENVLKTYKLRIDSPIGIDPVGEQIQQ